MARRKSTSTDASITNLQPNLPQREKKRLSSGNLQSGAAAHAASDVSDGLDQNPRDTNDLSRSRNDSVDLRSGGSSRTSPDHAEAQSPGQGSSSESTTASSLASNSALRKPASTKDDAAETAKWASARDWERHRKLITRLYYNHKLREIVEYMEVTHNFKATPRMFKDRFVKWGLSKNIRREEMVAAARKAYSRGLLYNKRSLIKIRDKDISWREIEGYFERSGLSVEQVVSSVDKAPPPSHVRCITPPLITPEELAAPEQALQSLKHYMVGCFDSGAWMARPDVVLLSKAFKSSVISTNLYESLVKGAVVSFKSGRSEEGGRELLTAKEVLRQFVQLSHPALTPILIHSLNITTIKNDMPGIGMAFLRQVASFAQFYFGQASPLYIFCLKLLLVRPSDFGEIIRCLSTFSADQFERVLYPLHPGVLSSRSDFAMLDKSPAVALQKIVKLQERIKSELPETDYRVSLLKFKVLALYTEAGYLDKAREEATRVMEESYSQQRWQTYCQAVVALGRVAYTSGNYKGAVVELIKLFETPESEDLWDLVYQASCMLEQSFLRLGRLEAADWAHQQRAPYLKPLN